jgi:hypothetical protein
MITHQVNEIKLIDDDGKEYTVFECQEGTEKASLKWIKVGPSRFRLSDGTPVAKIDDNTFKIDGNPRLVRVKSEVSRKKRLFSITAITLLMLNGTGAAAAELPTFELMGFPITPHQVAVVGSAHVQEQVANSRLTLGEMPASPHQMAVLTPRSRALGTAAAKTGSSVR